MEGQQLNQQIQNSVCQEESLQGHSGKNLDLSTCLLHRLREATHHLCTTLDSQEMRIQLNQEDF